MRIDETVKRETVFIASVTLVLSALMQAVFLVIGEWDEGVLFGNLLGGIAAISNFFLLGITVQLATSREAEAAKDLMGLSQRLRTLALLACALIGAAFPSFNIIATLIPFFFPRIAIGIRPFIGKK